MSSKYVAFLRGINVGGRIIKMADLKIQCEMLGLKDVKTVLQTGNILFESALQAPQIKQLLENSLTNTFNYPAIVQVYAITDLAQVVRAFPFSTEPEVHSYVVLTEGGLAVELSKSGYLVDQDVESVQISAEIIYWNVQKGMTLKSIFAKTLNKKIYQKRQTIRNIRTLQKLIN